MRFAMSWQQFLREGLADQLDENGDLAPPWEKFPQEERHGNAWRMRTGEGWLGHWLLFIESLEPAYAVRLDYLRRHPPAPFTWADRVFKVLYPQTNEEEAAATSHRNELYSKGLIASDIAFPTWISQQSEIRWPWEFGKTPEEAVRYRVREFWFASRQIAAFRDSSPFKYGTFPNRFRPGAGRGRDPSPIGIPGPCLPIWLG
jgi:hypothetical protein